MKKIWKKQAGLFLLLFLSTLFMAGCQTDTAAVLYTSSLPPNPSSSQENPVSSTALSTPISSVVESNQSVTKPVAVTQYMLSPRLKNLPKTAYLTFDDGPTEMTPQILDILKKYEVKATFFVVHKNSEKLETYMKRASEEGHEIAVHSYTHDYKKIYRSPATFLEDFRKTNEWIRSVTGHETKQFRFPGGSSISRKYLKKPVLEQILFQTRQLEMVHHDWNVSSGDAVMVPLNKEQVYCNVMKNASQVQYPVILMHDVVKNTGTRDALPEIIEGLRDMGYSFDTISHIQKPVQHRVCKKPPINSSYDSNPISSSVAESSKPSSLPSPSSKPVSNVSNSSHAGGSDMSSNGSHTDGSSSSTSTQLESRP